jgi:hypothetical protein
MPPLTPQSCRRYAVITLLVVAIAALVDYLLVMNAHLKYSMWTKVYAHFAKTAIFRVLSPTTFQHHHASTTEHT